MQVGIDSFAAALDENSRAVNPVRASHLRYIKRTPSSRLTPDALRTRIHGDVSLP
jgi:hypothetical protein